MFAENEPDDVYKALVADLAYSVVPTTLMGITIVAIGLYVHALTGQAGLLLATGLGGAASFGKLVLLTAHRRFNEGVYQSMRTVRRLEAAHATLTAGAASSVGALSAMVFAQPVIAIHLVATALLFGYCAGVVCRLSVRPRIATAAVALCSVPSLLSIATNREASHLIVGLLFMVFVVAGLETVSHVYRNARKHITVRLQMAALARQDPLTQLPNRLALREAFDGLPRGEGEYIALHAFDLDGFKAVNDEHGHQIGDQLLSLLADRLRRLQSGMDIAARIGGDEFVLVQTGVRRHDEVQERAVRVHDLLTRPYQIQGRTLRVGLSLGYSILPAESADLQTLMKPADEASYRAKRSGGGLQPGGGILQYC